MKLCFTLLLFALALIARGQDDIVPLMSWDGEIACTEMPGKLLIEMKSKDLLDGEIDARYLQLIKIHPELPESIEPIELEEYNRWAYGMVRTFEKYYPGEVIMVNETDKPIESYSKEEYPFKMRLLLDFKRDLSGTFLVMYPVLINRVDQSVLLPDCNGGEAIPIFELDRLFGMYMLLEVAYHKKVKQYVKSIGG